MRTFSFYEAIYLARTSQEGSHLQVIDEVRRGYTCLRVYLNDGYFHRRLIQIACWWMEQVLVLCCDAILPLLAILRLDQVFVPLCDALLARLIAVGRQVGVIVDRHVDEARTLEQHICPGGLFKGGYLNTHPGFPDFLDERDKIGVTGRQHDDVGLHLVDDLQDIHGDFHVEIALVRATGDGAYFGHHNISGTPQFLDGSVQAMLVARIDGHIAARIDRKSTRLNS